MAKIVRREWKSKGMLGERVRHTAFGYTLQVNGKQERIVSSAWTCEADAVKALAARLQQVKDGHCTPQTATQDVTLAALADRYLTYKGNTGKRSLKDDRRILTNRLLPDFGPGLPIRLLTEACIAQYEEQRVGKVSGYTVCNELTILRHMLRLAKKWGLLDRVPEIEMPKKPKGRTRFLSEEEISRLLKACQGSQNRFLLATVVLALNTGMRKGEILGLTWERIDLQADLGFSAKLTLYETKSGEPRGVLLNAAAVQALTAIESDPEKRTGRVFTRTNGEDCGTMRTAFESVVERAGIAHCRFHDLRHTAASHMVMRGRSLQDVKEILGHSDFRMTLRYAHLSQTHLRGAVDVLDGLTPMPAYVYTVPEELAQRSTHNAETNSTKTITV